MIDDLFVPTMKAEYCKLVRIGKELYRLPILCLQNCDKHNPLPLKILAALNPSDRADQQIDFLMRIVKRQ